MFSTCNYKCQNTRISDKPPILARTFSYTLMAKTTSSFFNFLIICFLIDISKITNLYIFHQFWWENKKYITNKNLNNNNYNYICWDFFWFTLKMIKRDSNYEALITSCLSQSIESLFGHNKIHLDCHIDADSIDDDNNGDGDGRCRIIRRLHTSWRTHAGSRARTFQTFVPKWAPVKFISL